MTRLAVLSDIHGNLLALEAVLADVEAQGHAFKIRCRSSLFSFSP